MSEIINFPIIKKSLHVNSFAPYFWSYVCMISQSFSTMLRKYSCFYKNCEPTYLY